MTVIADFFELLGKLFKLFFSGFSNAISLILDIPTYLNDFSNILPFPLKSIATFFISIFVFILSIKVLKVIMDVLSPIIDTIKDKLGNIILSFIGGGS